MKAMGIESDQEVTQLIGSEGTYAGLFAPSLQECKQLGVFSQQQALEWLGLHPSAGMSRCGIYELSCAVQDTACESVSCLQHTS